MQHVQQSKPANHVHPRYLVDPEDGEDTSQDAADLVSSHDEVQPANQLQEQQNFCKVELENEQKEIEEQILKVNEPAADPPKPRSRLALPKAAAKNEEQVEKKQEVVKPEAAKPVVAKPEVAKPVVAKPEVAKPVVAKPEVAKPVNPVSVVKQQVSKTTDEDFMIESDNIDENLYSSESDSTTSSDSTETSTSEEKKKKNGGKAVPGKAVVPVKQPPKLRFSSSSSNNSLQEKKGAAQAKPIQPKEKSGPDKTAQAINLESDSDSPEIKQKPQSDGVSKLTFLIPAGNDEDLEISGPENELDDDDFWNWTKLLTI